MAASGASEGVAVLALEQTAGRGRQGRTWSSPAQQGLYVSFVLRPRIEPARATIITLSAAIAVAETLIQEFHVPADIKWPNDVLSNRRKLSGILVEAATEGNQLQYAILGIGVNLNQQHFPDEIGQTATSLLLESGRRIEIDEFLKPLAGRLDRWYISALASAAEVISRWEQLSSYARECAVRVTSGDGSVEGVTRGLTSSGALLLELDDGKVREVVSGEVNLRSR
jgi:BirA family biotin operon repressor/biotin-[acetyl-CoA-carboxylase] ligase